MIYIESLADEEPISDATREASITLGAFIILITTVVLVILIKYRKMKILSTSSVNFLLIFLCGCFMAGAGVIIRSQDANNLSCNSSFWLLHLGFAVSFGSILVKTYRYVCR